MTTSTSKHYRVLVTGATGQLGLSLHKLSPQFPQFTCQFVSRSDLDLGDPSSLESYLEQQNFDVIINAAAYTAVDKAEAEAEVCDLVNHQSVAQLAKISHQRQTKLIHVSSDYVFDGLSYQPYTEEDPTGPQGIYGQTKLDGEKAMLAELPQHGMILRTSWVYSEFGQNFVKTMLRLGSERDALNVVFDQVGTPTYAGDLAQCIFTILSQDDFWEEGLATEIFNYSNEGVCSWYDFAKEIFEISKVNCQLSPIEGVNYPTPAKRPFYSVLNKKKIKEVFDLSIPHWGDSLKACLAILQEK